MDLHALREQCLDAGEHIILILPRRDYKPTIRLLPKSGPWGVVLGESSGGGTVAKFKTSRILNWLKVMEEPAYQKRKARNERRRRLG